MPTDPTATAATEKAAFRTVPKVGDRVRVTFEAEVTAVEQASANRGIAKSAPAPAVA